MPRAAASLLTSRGTSSSLNTWRLLTTAHASPRVPLGCSVFTNSTTSFLVEFFFKLRCIHEKNVFKKCWQGLRLQAARAVQVQDPRAHIRHLEGRRQVGIEAEEAVEQSSEPGRKLQE